MREEPGPVTRYLTGQGDKRKFDKTRQDKTRQEIPKDKGFSEVRTAKLDPPRQRPGDRPRVQRAGGAPREVPRERPLGQPML
jgi:hypothetical protein